MILPLLPTKTKTKQKKITQSQLIERDFSLFLRKYII